MMDLDDLRMVRALGGNASLAAAARQLDLTPPALTVRLQRLEKALGVVLAHRGARGIALTDEGRQLAGQAAGILAQIEALPAQVAGEAHALAGHLRVAAPLGFGRAHMARIVRDVHRAHPGLSVSLTLSEHPLRSAAAHDVVIHIGPLKDSSWIAHPLAPNRRLLCASPRYVRTHLREPLTHPCELQRLACLCLKENDEDLVRWRFSREREGSGKPEAVALRVSGPLSSNDGEVVTRWALDGLGIMARSEWEAGPLIASGRLVHLLPGWRMDDTPVLALTPVRMEASARLRTFVEACRQALQRVPWRADAAEG